MENVPGKGLEGRVDGRRLRIGQADFVAELGGWPAPQIPGTNGQWLLLGDEHGPLAWLVLDDRLREDAPLLLDACRARGWQVMLLSGDSSPMVGEIARRLGIDDARGGLSPDAKLDVLRELHRAAAC